MRSMMGEWSGKIRSTPTPPEIFRTVKVSRMPPPRRAMTIPEKSWMRSVSPSRILTCTRTVSPGENAGTSLFSDGFSRSSRMSLMADLFGVERAGARRKVEKRGILNDPGAPGQIRPEAGSIPLFLRLGRPPAEEIGPALARALQRPGTAPAEDLAVVARDQDLRNGQAAKLARPR